MYITMFSGKFNCDEKKDFTYIYEFGKPLFLIIYYINERRKRIVDSNSQKQTLRNGNERKRYMLERTSHKIKTQG